MTVEKMQRLSGFDASLLQLETPDVPMNVAGAIEIDTSTMKGGYNFERFREGMRAQVNAIPELRAKLADSPWNLDTPVWVEDEHFNIDNHVRRAEIPPPGTRHEISDLAGALIAAPMDRSLPLWRMWVLEGVAGVKPEDGGRVVVLFVIQHSIMDGTSGPAIWLQLSSDQVDAPAPEPIAGFPNVRRRQIALDGLRRFALRPWFLITKVLPAHFRVASDTIRRFASGRAMPRTFTAPKVLFNGKVFGPRTVGYAKLDLAKVKTVKNWFGVTVNDVALAVVSGAARKYLLDRGALPHTSLIAMAPVGVFEGADDMGRNNLTAMFTALHTNIADPAHRLKAIAETTSVGKEHSSAKRRTLLQDWANYVAPGVIGAFVALYMGSRLAERRPPYNLSISNVPLSPIQRYLQGGKIIAMYPLGPPFNGVGLNVSMMSLNGSLDIGLVGCAHLLPDMWDLADALPAVLEELVAAAK
ncbi:WS/DGAT/MGAT family O-acyltransferase [Mycobacterium sp.]|uniref:WS/DGAT/MGAT family O-acyltransferase n=1 Tax=Mycobacterium sp. TaxID=1785 RepID=UPI002D961114|nr:wax ester/triacylglycerol synthase family O-acyltransferase [Mycobacterium sp.]